MSDDRFRPESTAETEADARAAVRAAGEAASRRRWITLGELLAVMALVISALTLWNSWNERSDSEAVKNADARRASARAGALVLVTTGSGGGVLTLKSASPDQSVQSQKVLFPTALGAAPAETTGEPRIEAAWFEHALKKARELAKLPDDSRGDEQLPVAITTHFLVDGEPHEDVALYDIGYGISGHWFGGHSITLRGVSLVSRVTSGSARARLDARWNHLFLEKSATRG